MRDRPDGRRFANDSRGFLYLIEANDKPKVYADLAHVERTMGPSLPRVDLHISRTRDGELLTSSQDGVIRMLVPDSTGTAAALPRR